MSKQLFAIFALVFCTYTALAQTDCWTTNTETGLFYNLTAMERGSATIDYQYEESEPGFLNAYFVNICENSKEYCTPETPVCEQQTSTSFPYLSTFQSHGSLNDATWLPYQPDETQDGVSILYNSTESCGDFVAQSLVNILCDLSVPTGIIDDVSGTACFSNVSMRSKYGCGYNPNEPLTCQNTTELDPVSCTTTGKANFECSSGDLVISVTGNQNVPKYSFHVASNYSYDYDYDYYNETSSYYDDSDDNDDSDDSDVYGGSYKLQFSQLFEVDSGKKVPHSNVALSSLKWVFSTPEVVLFDDEDCTQETTFNITNTDGPSWTKLVFVNHLSMAGNSTSAKFDVIIEDYSWTSSDDNTNLVLSLMFTGDVGSESSVENSTTATCGNSYLEISPVAYGYPNSSDPSVNETVSASYTDSGKIEISYSHFEGSLVHDPTFGIRVVAPEAPAAPCDEDSCSFQSFTLSELDSNPPSITYGDDSGEWTVVFQSLSEVQATNESFSVISGSTSKLADSNWEMSEPTSRMLESGLAQTSFVVSTGESDRWNSISLEFFIAMKHGITHFDVIITIEGYSWVSEDDSTSLQITMDMGGPGQISYNYNTVLVGEAYIQTPTSYTSSSSAQISTVTLSYTETVLTTISHFSDSITAELVVGINSETDPAKIPFNMVSVEGDAEISDEDDSSTWWVWVLVPVSVVVALTVVATLAYIVYLNKSKTKYETIE